ncbi:MAG: hypothetical protein HYW45_01645 [Candidatus Daviesbacteria bacterium]|nr:MAG: hypothetical protein HYW45_01645 [Candidatus Daviesbacteria bacterium]
MKVLLLHGPAQISSRSKLLNLKKDFESSGIVTFPTGSNLPDILGAISTPSLLSNNQLIILENPPEDLVFNSSLFPDHLPKGELRSSLILWFDHEVSTKKPILEEVKKNKGQILFFPAEKEASIFPFLDLLASRDKKAFVEISRLQKTHEKFSDLQYLMTMIFYLLRTLLITPANAAPFVRQKLDKQRKNFSQDELKNLYKFVLVTDFKIKSGLLDLKQAEFLLINKFAR